MHITASREIYPSNLLVSANRPPEEEAVVLQTVVDRSLIYLTHSVQCQQPIGKKSLWALKKALACGIHNEASTSFRPHSPGA